MKRTAVIATLEEPLASGQSAIWCSTFQVAWNELKQDVFKEPVRVKGAETLADRLNRAPQSAADLPADSYCAAAGWVKDGIIERIHKEMAEKFPATPPPDLRGAERGPFMAFAFLRTEAKFTIPFFENDEHLAFKDSAGVETPVKSFGIRERDDYAYYKLREQVQILFELRKEKQFELDEFAIDPCKDSAPNQIILAAVRPAKTLAETLNELERKVASSRFERKFGPNDTLLIPNIRFRLTRRFGELEGMDKPFLNPGFEGAWFELAQQVIQFKLDKSGAELESEAKLYALPVPTHYTFDRPFLVVMKKRGAAHPFFTMWVDGDDLLDRWE